MDEQEQTVWWQKTQALTGVSLLGLLFVIVSPLMVSANTTFFGMPLSYFLAAIVVPVVLVVGIFWVSGRQERLDRRHRASGV
jgi:putative solute:sodium symporter small subunit